MAAPWAVVAHWWKSRGRWAFGPASTPPANRSLRPAHPEPVEGLLRNQTLTSPAEC